MKKRLTALFLVAVLVVVTGCGSAKEDNKEKDGDKKVSAEGSYKVVATTTMLTDLAKVIGGDKVTVEGLMGPGVDPHLYKASAGDVTKMREADMVVINGLHLEGQMGEIFEKLAGDKKLISEVGPSIDESGLLPFEGGTHDPHIWFNVLYWKTAAKVVYDGYVELDESNKEYYKSNYEAYVKELDELHKFVQERVAEVPEESRVLVTAHDAFNYFGKEYGFDVRGLQGISTESEAGTKDVTDLAQFIVDKKIKAIFVESSVPKKNIEALQEAVKAKGFDVKIGGELYSDSLGNPETEAGNYVGMVKANVNTIVDALK